MENSNALKIKTLRFFDIFISISLLIVLFPILIIILLLSFFDTGSPLFIQKRVGKHLQTFKLIKFRTFPVKETNNTPTHLADFGSVSPIGHFLRKSKLDELPQLWNVLLGQMSLVGPRPCLLNQEELIAYRRELNVFQVLPGITGLAQTQRIDMSTPQYLAEIDAKMIQDMSIPSYFKYLLLTFAGCYRESLEQ